MSKSLGNGIDPIEVIDKYGADALRFSLVMGVAPGSDIRMSEEKIESFRNFANKIWNASRFVLMNLQDFEPQGLPDASRLSLADKWILTRFQETVRSVTDDLENFDLGYAATKLYDFIWSTFCDWYIELAKQGLHDADESVCHTTKEVLLYLLTGTLKLLHPYMPFITEEVYGYLPGAEGMLITARWPEVLPEYDFAADAARMEGVMEVIRAVRNLRAEMNVAPGRRARLILKPHEGWADALAAAAGYFQRLAGASAVEQIAAGAPNPPKSASAVTEACALFVPLGELVDVRKGDRPPRQGSQKRRGRGCARERQALQRGLPRKSAGQPGRSRARKARAGAGQGRKLKARMEEIEALR